MLEAIRDGRLADRFYQAPRSEMFGKVRRRPQRRRRPSTRAAPTPWPRSTPTGSRSTTARPTASTPATASSSTTNPAPRRDVRHPQDHARLAAILAGPAGKLYLGNLDAKRDWGFAGDYVEAMWRMLQQAEPDDYVVATGETHSVREFCERPSGCRPRLAGYVEIDPRYLRPTEVDLLCGDASKARATLGWDPGPFQELVRIMVDADLALPRATSVAAGP